MIGEALLGAADLFFKATSTSFALDPDPKAAARAAAGAKEAAKDIKLQDLREAGASCIVAALREFSFPETLSLLFGLESDTRQCILDALIEHHELRSALDFALHFEDPSRFQNSNFDFAEIARRFLDRLGAAKAAKASRSSQTSQGKPADDDLQSVAKHRLIDVLTSSQLVLVTGISAQRASRIVAARRKKLFASIDDLLARSGDIPAEDLQKIEKLF